MHASLVKQKWGLVVGAAQQNLPVAGGERVWVAAGARAPIAGGERVSAFGGKRFSVAGERHNF